MIVLILADLAILMTHYHFLAVEKLTLNVSDSCGFEMVAVFTVGSAGLLVCKGNILAKRTF